MGRRRLICLRDRETGLDYLRARYYDPALGRFISRDAYQGELNDPMSLHKYQYAHANPVVNTDPSGYVTLTDLAATAAITAILGGLGLTTGGAIATGLNGGSTQDVISIYDQYFAGMTDALTFGYSTKARKLAYKDQGLKHSGIYFTLGRLGGVISSMLIGSFAATFKTVGSAPWWAKAALGYDFVGAGVGIFDALKDGATLSDIFAFLPLIAGLSPAFNLNFKLDSKGFSFGGNGTQFKIGLDAQKRVEQSVSILRDYGDFYGTYNPISIKKLRIALGKAGMSVSDFDIRLNKKLDPGVHGQTPNYVETVNIQIPGQRLPQNSFRQKYYTDRKGRPIVEITPDGLGSLENAIVTVGHEFEHVRQMQRGSLQLSELEAEAAGVQFLMEFLRKTGRKL